MQVKLTTSRGNITIDLHTDRAPATVDNFLGYVRSGYYDGSIFHRVIKDFMIQAGGFDAEMNSLTADDPIRNEADNGLSNTAGAVSMARTPDPHSARAQFFINTGDNVFLDHRDQTAQGWGYCVFGEVSEGMDVVAAIEATPTTQRAGHNDVPVEPIMIEHAEILDA